MCNVHFIFYLDPSMTAGQGREILRFWEFRCLTSSSLCSLLLRNLVTRPISPMMILINWGNNVDLQHALSFDLDPSMTTGQGHKILRFCEFRFLTGNSLCSLLLRNYSTDFSNDEIYRVKNSDLHQHIHRFDLHPLHDCRSRSQNTSILWI